MEQTLIILKPDAVRRNLIGAIVQRFETAGLKVDRLELRNASRELVTKHYPSDDGWLGTVGQKTLDDYLAKNRDPVADLGVSTPVEIGLLVKGWLVEFMTSGPVVVMVLSGNRAIESVRKIVGSTLPVMAAPGTIRGDYSTDSPDLANVEKRPVSNLIHASGDPDEAAREIALWFGDDN